jgi:branched-chain amino acid transport system permease protein
VPDRFPWRAASVAAAFALLFLYAVAFASPYGLRVMTVAGVYALAALGYQLVFGLGGALSMAQGAFFGLGAYTAGILGSRWGVGFAGTFPAALFVPALAAVGIGLAVLRLQSHYFALATLGFAQVLLLAAVNAPDLTGGANGLSGVPGVVLFGWAVPRGLPLAAVVWTVVALGGALAAALARARWGRSLRLARDDSLAAVSLGLDPARLRLGAFVLSAVFAGAAGALSVHTQRVVSPEVLEFPVMVTVLTISVVGGRGRFAATVLAAVLLAQVPEWFRFLERSYLLLHGAVLLAVIVLAPDGLAGLLARWLPSLPPVPPPPCPLPPRSPCVGEVLRVKRLAKAFGGVRAVDGVSFAVEAGTVTGLIGANGSGKTTLINLIGGFEAADGGRVFLCGRDVSGARADQRARAGLARTFQTSALPPEATALDAVAAAVLADRAPPPAPRWSGWGRKT